MSSGRSRSGGRETVGGLEEARFGLVGVGEGATLEAEELGLEQGFGDGGAVDADEGALATGAFPVDQEDRWEAPGRRLMTEELAELDPDGDDAGALAEQLSQQRHGAYPTPILLWSTDWSTTVDFHLSRR
jgi:hypothetical protein